MNVIIAMKCDRSGRTESVQVDSTDIPNYEEIQARREETLEKIKEFLADLPADDLPDLFAVYRGEIRHFINVSADFCDKPVKRLLDQLFHASDPKARKPRKRKAAAGNGDAAEENSGEKKVQVGTETLSSSEQLEQTTA